MPKFGNRSKSCIETIHPDLALILEVGIRRCPVDFGIHEGARTVQRQQLLFDTGKSRVNPKAYASLEDLASRGKHIVLDDHPEYRYSRAVDFHVSEKHKGTSLAWDDVHLAAVAMYLIRTAQQLQHDGAISHLLRWGGDWNGNGVISLDQRLKDFPHIELIKP